jgi:transcriptional regulator with XRE-family HTH domain
MTATVPGSKPYRDRLRAELVKAGVTGQCLTGQVAADLARQGMRPRQAWRYAGELSQRVVAMRFNEVTGDPRAPMTASRIWEFERWPSGDARPTARTLAILARVYGTTWDLLVDAADLAHMPDADREAYAEAAQGRARATGADAPPPAEEIHIWMATADRITRHVAIPRQAATMPLLISVLQGMAGDPEHGRHALVLPFAQQPPWRHVRGRAWLRRLSRDPSVHPWLLLDQFTLSVQQELAPARGERGASGIRRRYRTGAGWMTAR